jgi:hypothetical protein
LRSEDDTRASLQDSKVNVRIKIAALWVTAVLFYIYGDYFGLFVPGKLGGMLDGKIFPLGNVSQGILVATSLMVSIPSAMVFLSLVLNAPLSRRLNMIVGVLFTVIALVTMWGWVFQIMYGTIEAIITGLIVWNAWRWPRHDALSGGK